MGLRVLENKGEEECRTACRFLGLVLRRDVLGLADAKIE